MASLKKCIEAKCKDCTYDQAAPGTWRDQVEECRVTACPLWPVRPMTTATVIAVRKAKGTELNIDSLIDGLDDEDEDENAPNTVSA